MRLYRRGNSARVYAARCGVARDFGRGNSSRGESSTGGSLVGQVTEKGVGAAIPTRP
jgi:hypothetical protein